MKYVSRAVGAGLMAIYILLISIGTFRVMDGVDKRDVDLNVRYEIVNESYEEGDVIIATSLFQWYNARHYNNESNSPVLYWDTGYHWGSHAPIYEASENLLVADFSTLQPEGYVWLITNPVEEDPEIPENWRAISVIEGLDSTIIQFEVN